MRKLLFSLLFYCQLCLAIADPVQVTLPAHSGDRAIQLEGYIFDDREESIRVVDAVSLSSAKATNIDLAMRNSGALAGINGGFFGPDGSPLGRMIADSVQTGGITHGSLTSGIIFRNDRGLFLLRSKEFLQKPRGEITQLVQAGPFLVDGGKTVTGLEATKSRTRTIVIHDMGHRWFIGCSSPATLAELGKALGGGVSVADVRAIRVLNMDGGSSSALWINGQTKRANWKPVRNFVAVVKK